MAIIKKKIWFVFRFVAVMSIPFGITFYLSAILDFNFKFQPLIRDNRVLIPLLVGNTNYDALNEVFNFDILKYKTILLNNVKIVIGGDKKDYEHEVEVFVKLRENENKVNYGESKIILDRAGRYKTILEIKDIIFKANVNLKPEVLLGNNKIITTNKEVKGYVEIIAKLTTLSWFILYFLSLLAMFTIINLSKNIYQFIFYGKGYFKLNRLRE